MNNIQNEMVFIRKTKGKFNPMSGLRDEIDLIVQGKTLKECRKHFDELWEDEK